MINKPFTVHFNTDTKKQIKHYATEAGAMRAINKHVKQDDNYSALYIAAGDATLLKARDLI